MATDITIARPYAHAIFAIALEENQLSQWAAFLQLLDSVIVTLRASLRDPRVGEVKIGQWLVEAVTSASKTQQHFIHVLASKKRLLLVPEISHLFLALKAEHEKSLTVEVISAYPLSAAEMDLFSTQLSKKHGQQVVLHNRIDTEIMGGAKIRVGDSVLDGSVKSKLVKLRQVLMSA